ncbi:hypothetical protein GQ43DRAFT_468630 [Delitschia confertaspora ATCC 74209]|uniref:Ornithine decarboxylase antizyme n=1 Tax=Delitschia confertaspora ATCC 74209 TaxID=1513339 RepID=A0A9P4JV27_9PLEO|nr:hypothetical protein GQ43DRAFT_468630 [Delitschia confertaspora ATCC 74209]
MARTSTSTHNSSSSNSYENYYGQNSNIRASCYAVNTSTTALQGFHYSTTGAGGGIPSPPLSPPLAARHASAAKQSISPNRSGMARRGGAAYTITGECERLFCETLMAVFLGEGNLARQDSLVMGMHNQSGTAGEQNHMSDMQQYADRIHGYPSPEMDGIIEKRGLVNDWIEIFDYVGGIRFMGFVAEKDGEKAMFVFFDQSVIGGDLKPGLMALLELCDTPYFSCSRLMVCLDRQAEARLMGALVKDLGWIGFQLATLNDWTGGDEITSDRWLFMDMDV